MKASRLATSLAEGMIFGIDPHRALRVSDPLEAGILESAVAEAVRLREVMDNNLAAAIVSKLAEAF